MFIHGFFVGRTVQYAYSAIMHIPQDVLNEGSLNVLFSSFAKSISCTISTLSMLHVARNFSRSLRDICRFLKSIRKSRYILVLVLNLVSVTLFEGLVSKYCKPFLVLLTIIVGGFAEAGGDLPFLY